MFYEKKFLGKSLKYQKECFNFLKGDKLSLKTEGYNFIIEDGLSSGPGLCEIVIPDALEALEFPVGTQVLKAWSYKFFSDYAQKELHFLIFYCSDKKLYSIALSSTILFAIELGDITLERIPEMLAYRVGSVDRAIFYNEEDLVFWGSSTAPYISNSGAVYYKIKSAAVFGGKIFSVLWGDEYKLHYCDIKNEPDFIITAAPTEDAGEISIRKEFGQIVRILNFFDCLIIITEIGVLRVDIDEAGKFVVSECFLSDAKIYTDTVAVCGSQILMLTSLGMVVFEGNKAKKSDILKVSAYGSLGEPAAAYFDGKYYLTLKMPFDSDIVGSEASPGGVNNALVVINPGTMQKDIMRGFDIRSFTSVIDNKFARLFMTVRGSSSDIMCQFCTDGTSFGVPLKKVFRLLGFGSDNICKKVVRSICIRGTLDCILKIKSKKEVRSFEVAGGKTNRFVVNMVSDVFDIEIVAEAGGKIDMLELEFAKI